MALEKPLKLLLVEDDPNDVLLVRAQLAQARGTPPFAVESVPQVSLALRQLAGRDIDVVLLDLGLPDAQGTEAVSRLVLESPETPVVVLTGVADEALGLRAVQEGAQDYLVKGRAEGPLLERSLRFAIERKRAEQALARLATIMGALCYDCGRKLAADRPPARYQH